MKAIHCVVACGKDVSDRVGSAVGKTVRQIGTGSREEGEDGEEENPCLAVFYTPPVRG